MDIQEFFEISAGKWFSQRTSTYHGRPQPETGKSDLRIEFLAQDDPVVSQLVQQFAVTSGLAICGARLTWNAQMESAKAKQAGSVLLIVVPDPEQPQSGRLLRSRNEADTIPITSRYQIGIDGALTLVTQEEALTSEERLWFASPNLRLRTTILKQKGVFSMASFTTEIRMGLSQPDASRTATATSPTTSS